MRIHKVTRKLATGASVALATGGLSCGTDNGAVDPVPPPLQCDTVDQGQSLGAAGSLVGTTLTVVVEHLDGGAVWSGNPGLSSLTGADLAAVEPLGPRVTITLELDSPTTTAGSFTIEGALAGDTGGLCLVSRRFEFTISGNDVFLARIDPGDLPLKSRDPAHIEILGQDGLQVTLRARTEYEGEHQCEWSVSGGEIQSTQDGRARWLLPSEPGLYQAQLVVDYGDQGLSMDSLALQVS